MRSSIFEYFPNNFGCVLLTRNENEVKCTCTINDIWLFLVLPEIMEHFLEFSWYLRKFFILNERRCLVSKFYGLTNYNVGLVEASGAQKITDLPVESKSVWRLKIAIISINIRCFLCNWGSPSPNFDKLFKYFNKISCKIRLISDKKISRQTAHYTQNHNAIFIHRKNNSIHLQFEIQWKKWKNSHKQYKVLRIFICKFYDYEHFLLSPRTENIKVQIV